jgi:hypothetical protein
MNDVCGVAALSCVTDRWKTANYDWKVLKVDTFCFLPIRACKYHDFIILLHNMVVAGTDTTPNPVEFTFAEMMNTPEVLREVQREKMHPPCLFWCLIDPVKHVLLQDIILNTMGSIQSLSITTSP